LKFQNLDYQSSKSLYLQVSEIIEEKITSKEISVGEKLPPQENLKKMFHVSIDTVKEALSRLTEEGYISRRPRYGTYVISAVPKKGLNLKSRNGICIFACPFAANNIHIQKRSSSIFLDNLITGMEEKIKAKGAYLMYSTELSLGGRKKDIAGLIVTGIITSKLFKEIKKTRIPFVLIGDIWKRTKSTEEADVIATDDLENSYTATKHLIELGHTRIAFLPNFVGGFPWDTARADGYKKAIKEAGIKYSEDLVINIDTEHRNLDTTYAGMKNFLDKSVKFTAVVYVHNYAGVSIIKALGEKGLKYPEDVSIAGVEGLPELTNVTHNIEEMGRLAVERLFKRISDPDMKPERIISPAILYLNNSTRKIIK
jgi:LacI family transcriptional regulator